MKEEQKQLQGLLAFYCSSFLMYFNYSQKVLIELKGHPMDQLDALPAYIEHLTHHLKKGNHLIPPLLLLNIACCIPGQYRGIRPTLLCLAKERGGFSERRLDEATGFLDKFYQHYSLFLELPAEIKHILFPKSFSPEENILNLDKFLFLLPNLGILEFPHTDSIKNIYEQLDEETYLYLKVLSQKLKKIKAHLYVGKEIENAIKYFKKASQSEALENEVNFYYELEYSEEGINKPSQPFQTILSCEEICGGCGHELIILFRLNLKDQKLKFLQIPQEESLDIAFCLLCTDFCTTYTSVDSSGKITWRSKGKHSEKKVEKCISGSGEAQPELICDKLILGAKRIFNQRFSRIAKECNASRIGGKPIWIQSAEHPKCLECKQKMKFVGQIDGCHFPHFPKENNYYAFFCSNCLITAVNSQYT